MNINVTNAEESTVKEFAEMSEKDPGAAEITELLEQDVETVSGGILALIAMPFIVGFVAYRIAVY